MKQLTLVFLVTGNQVLLAMKKRGFGAGRWNGVGGKVDPGETVIQAMIRETEEEILVTPIDYDKAAEIVFHETVGGSDASMLVHVYLCSKWRGEPKESEEMAPKWFNVNELPFEYMWPDDPYWLPQVLGGEKITAEFTLKDNDVIVASKVETVDFIEQG